MYRLQCIGSTVERFRFGWNSYKSSQRLVLAGGTPKQNYFHENLLRDNHYGLIEDCEKRIIDKIDPSDPTVLNILGCGSIKHWHCLVLKWVKMFKNLLRFMLHMQLYLPFINI